MSGTDSLSEIWFGSYGIRDVILYALGVGSQLNSNLLSETDEHFTVLPSFTTTFPFLGFGLDLNSIAGLKYNPSSLLHLQSTVQIFHFPFPLHMQSRIQIRNESKVRSIVNKTSGTLIHLEMLSFEITSNKLLTKHDMKLFIKNTNSIQKKASARTPLSSSKASRISSEIIPFYQAFVYRLSGDFNPLHVDLNSAQNAGFRAPILHGLCTLGFTVRIILNHLTTRYLKQRDLNENSEFKMIFKEFCERVDSINASFENPVYPSDTISVYVEIINEKLILFETWNEIKNIRCISNGKMMLKSRSKL